MRILRFLFTKDLQLFSQPASETLEIDKLGKVDAINLHISVFNRNLV